jgi:organic hydroperoxide reductase OsmC/OhrA
MIERILYTAEATSESGRQGHARTSDGRLSADLDVPTEMGGTGWPGTNPEQLFAAGYSACFQSSLMRVAAGRKLTSKPLASPRESASGRHAVAGSGLRSHSTSTPRASIVPTPPSS